jgi:mannose-6-phosphate isomerase-like protein (cupin superfamily)
VTGGGAHAFAAALAGGRIAAPDAELVIAEWRDPGGATGGSPRYIAPLHVHHEDDEAWYVLEGALVVRSGSDDLTVTAGGAILVPRGTPHTYWNPLESPTRYLLVMTPRIAALIDTLHGGPGPGGVEAAFAAHASEFLGWPA